MDNQQRKLEEDLIWLGGFWCGEGTVTLTYRHKWRGRYSALTPLLSIVNTEKALMEDAFSLFDRLGLAYYRQCVYTERDRQTGRKARYSLIVAGMKRCVKTLAYLTPVLRGCKKQKAVDLAAFCASRLAKPPNAPIDAREIELAEAIREGKFDSKSLTDYTPDSAT